MDPYDPYDPYKDPKILHRDGDLMLVVGPSHRHILVQSSALTSSSSVFKAMFGPNWKEGQELRENKDSPSVLLLLEDDEDAIEKICRIVHGRAPGSFGPVLQSDVLQIALTAQKYDMAAAIKAHTDDWLWPRDIERLDRAALDPMDLIVMPLAAAYVLRHEEAFEKLSRYMILGHGSAYYTAFADPAVAEAVPRGLADLLELRRKETLIRFSKLIEYTGGEKQCSCENFRPYLTLRRDLLAEPVLRARKSYSWSCDDDTIGQRLDSVAKVCEKVKRDLKDLDERREGIDPLEWHIQAPGCKRPCIHKYMPSKWDLRGIEYDAVVKLAEVLAMERAELRAG